MIELHLFKKRNNVQVNKIPYSSRSITQTISVVIPFELNWNTETFMLLSSFDASVNPLELNWHDIVMYQMCFQNQSIVRKIITSNFVTSFHFHRICMLMYILFYIFKYLKKIIF